MEKLLYSYKYPHPAVTTDCVIFGFDGKKLKVLLIQRGIEPYKGAWAFPGGFLKMDETADQCARRELFEETGLTNASVEQFHTFSDIYRDPRERVITIAYQALVRISDVKGGDDAAVAKWFDINEMPPLAFDHEKIMKKAIEYLRSRVGSEPVGFELLPEVFQVGELLALYKAIFSLSEDQLDPRNFAKKLHKTGIIEQVGERPAGTPSRIPIKYKFNRVRYDEYKKEGFKIEF